MDLSTTFYVIYVLLGLILLFAIILYARVRKSMKVQHDEVMKQQSKYLAEFWENLSKGLESYEVAFNASLGAVTTEVASHGKTMKEFRTDQKKVFSDLVNSIKVEYKEFISELNKLNSSFGSMTEDIKSNKKDYEKLLPVMEENYKKLELISDKGKEIISDHEKTLMEHNMKLDKTLKGLTEKMRDEVRDMKAETEISLNDELKKASEHINSMTEHADMIFKEISGNSKTQIEEIATLGLEQIKELNDSTIISLANKIDALRKQVYEENKQSITELNSIEKNLKEFIETIETKLEGSSKRKLF